MSNTVESVEGKSSWSPEPSRPLDPAIWSAWLAKNRVEEQRGAAARLRIAIIIGLLIVVALALLLLLGPSPIADVQPLVGALSGTIVGGRP